MSSTHQDPLFSAAKGSLGSGGACSDSSLLILIQLGSYVVQLIALSVASNVSGDEIGLLYDDFRCQFY